MSPLHNKIFAIAAFAAALSGLASSEARADDYSPSKVGTVDIFAGVDFNYKDITFIRQYDLLINVTPAVKWYFAEGWTLAAQALVPVKNDYGDYYSKLRPGIATISKEARIGERLLFKGSAGLFSNERYGLDIKLFYPLTDWLALEGEAGLTGFGSFAVKPKFSYMKRVTGTIGGDIWLKQWNTQLRGVAGRFTYGDYGLLGELNRHFDHTTVGLYAQWTDLGGFNGGYRFIVALPPYQRGLHKVNFRLADNFRFNYNVEADPYFGRMYRTDPEQSERDGWFSRSVSSWGQDSMEPDFRPKGTESDKTAGNRTRLHYAQGLVDIHTADMDPDGTARFGSDFLNKNTLPEQGFLYMGESYHTFNYYMDATLFRWLQMRYTCTERKIRGEGDIGGYGSKDRYFSAKVRPVREGRLMPAIAFGADDFAISRNYTPSETAPQYYFGNYWAAATKHFATRVGEIGATVGYRHYILETNSRWNGIVGGVSFRPSFADNLRASAEWNACGINIGAEATFWNFLMLRASLIEMKYFNFGINLLFSLKRL